MLTLIRMTFKCVLFFHDFSGNLLQKLRRSWNRRASFGDTITGEREEGGLGEMP